MDTKPETDFIACCLLEPEWIDRGVQQGVTDRHFTHPFPQAQWRLLCRMRLAGEPIDHATAYAYAHKHGLLRELGTDFLTIDLDILPSSAKTILGSIVAGHQRREALRAISTAKEMLEAEGADMDEVRKLAEAAVNVCTHQDSTHRPLRSVAKDAIEEARETIEGRKATRTLIFTGLPTFDRLATPIEPHEYVVVGARTSHGKSSLLLQIAGHNLSLGRRVAIFTLETSDKAVVKQMAAARTGINLRDLPREFPDKQKEYLARLEKMQAMENLVIFDRDLRLDAIFARCRLLAQSFRPDLVVLDYLGIIGGTDGSAYERMSALSKAMIPLRKTLGCALLVGAQLNRGPEGENREPRRTDFRDAGGIEEDAHRIISIWRPDQELDKQYFDCHLLQLKLRDGPLVKLGLQFHAPTTRFIERAVYPSGGVA